jgi:hypothetical protein
MEEFGCREIMVCKRPRVRRKVRIMHALKGCTSIKRRGDWKLDEMTLSEGTRGEMIQKTRYEI